MSGNTNIVLIEGRLTRDPSYSKTSNGKSICKFSIANNRYYYAGNAPRSEVSFFDFVSWGRLADKAAINLSKGRHVLITGEIRQNTYTSKSGEKKQKVYIVALEIKYLDKKNVSDTRVIYDRALANSQKLCSTIEDNLEASF